MTTSKPNIRESLVELLNEALASAGDIIEQLVECEDCHVSLDVFFNQGAESIMLSRLSGEFTVEVFRVEKIGEETN